MLAHEPIAQTEFPGRSTPIMDQLEVLKAQETTTYHCSDYLADLRHQPQSSDCIDEWCRSKMIEWCFQIIDYVHFNRETVLISISFLDRFLSGGSPRAKRAMRSRKEYQLAAMTTLYMAIKLFEPSILPLHVLSDLSQGGYAPAEFIRMEMDVLFGIKWLLNGPTAISFLGIYQSLLPPKMSGVATEDIIQQARYQIELSAKDYGLLKQNPSTIAFAAIVQSVRRITSASAPEATLRRPKLMKRLEELIGLDGNSVEVRTICELMKGCNSTPCMKMMRPIDNEPFSKKSKSDAAAQANSKLQGSHQSRSPRGISN